MKNVLFCLDSFKGTLSTFDIISISKEIYAESEELLKNHKNMILRLADILMTKDFLGTEEVREVLLSSAEN